MQEDLELQNKLKKHIHKLNTHNPRHKFAILYNAWTEKVLGERLSVFREDMDFLEADSGGLQIISKGDVITPEMKKSVYENQAKWSDYAMGFDEIPIVFSGEKSSITNFGNRMFDTENLKHYASLTGKNFREQIELFVERKSKSKPIFIIHGNDYDSYMFWAETALNEIPRELRPFIGGVASSGASIGIGILEDIKRAFYYSELSDELKQSKHLHLLGVGSISRLLPYLIFMKNGLYKDHLISYDSTSHSSALHRGRYFSEQGNIKLNKYFSREYHVLLENMNSFATFDLDVDELFFIMTNSSTEFKVQRNNSRSEYIHIWVSAILSSVFNFKNYVDSLLTNNKKMKEMIYSDKKFFVFDSLEQVVTKKDFEKWSLNNERSVKSSPIASKNNCLEDLFS